MDKFSAHIEALIFAAEQPISAQEIVACLSAAFGEEILPEVVDEEIEKLTAKYSKGIEAFEITQIAGGYRFMTKNDFHPTIGVFLNQKSRKKLSAAAMETLAIVAYRQPVTKVEVESIRGVNSDYTLQKLLEKELVVITGRAEMPGRPLLYGTSQSLLDFFGINSADELPKPKELEPERDNEIGTPTESQIEEKQDGGTD